MTETILNLPQPTDAAEIAVPPHLHTAEEIGNTVVAATFNLPEA